ncbi:MAG: hypothetical protein CMJ49_12355 [Planctomycetaceae bacterium]|nr:hypothetical protein [Planctomycetaceae bacterium]
MQRTYILFAAFLLVSALAPVSRADQPADAFLRDLPPGLYLQSSDLIPPDQTKAIGRKLGGDITQLTNSILNVHGRTIQVNAITASDDAAAQAIHAAILKMKPYPYCLRTDHLVIEYVGRNIDEALAVKTSYELGFVPKPDHLRYRVVARLATARSADYMALNPLFNQFIAFDRGANDRTIQQIKELSKKITFGQSLTLRNPNLASEPAAHQFTPAAAKTNAAAPIISYTFDQLPNRHGVPYVTAELEIVVDDSGLTPTNEAPPKALTAATPFWPADDPRIKALAERITEGHLTNEDKAMAILQWLTPGKNLKYSGQTGSRWGVIKVLTQKSGHCWDFADCFVTLCRAADVPARQVAGWLYGASGHVWAEFYRQSKGWQQVDATGGGALPCGIYHIPYFTTDTGDMPILYVAMPNIEIVESK